jgi:hypothetical protein
MRKRVFKWWWGWNPTNIEEYLEMMAKDGWKLVETSFAFIFFVFERSESENVRFVFDYQNQVKSEYLTIIEDTGWSLVNRAAGWLLWKKSFDDKRPELMSDNQSLIDRNNRLTVFLAAMTAFQIPILVINILNYPAIEQMFGNMFIFGIYVCLVTLMGFSFVNLYLTNKKLKSNGQR